MRYDHRLRNVRGRVERHAGRHRASPADIVKAMELTREQLFRQIWAEPIGLVAGRYGMTGNGLAKICDRLNIPRPIRSHWTRNPSSRDIAPPLPPPPLGLSEIVAFGSRQTRQSPGLRTRLDAASRRIQLIKVAREIAVGEGLSALTMRRLGRVVGVSETQVHNCFGGRTDLLVAMARHEIARQEAARVRSVARNADRRTRIILSTIGYLHEAAQHGPLLQMLLRVPEVKEALRAEQQKAASSARAPIIDWLTETGTMDAATARASTSALAAVSRKAGGIVAARRAPLAMVEQLCVSIVMAGVASDERLVGR